jgi:hypothetical protein
MSNPTFAEITTALRRYANKTSTAAANVVMERVTGSTRLGDVDPSQYAAIIAALDGDDDSERPNDHDGAGFDHAKIYARWNSARAPRGTD